MSIARRLWARRRERPVFVALSVLTLAAILVWPLVDAAIRHYDWVTGFRYYDFGAYAHGVDAGFSGEEVYVRNDDGSFHGSFLYPPITLLFFYPFATLPFETGAVFLGSLSLVLLWIGLEAVAAQLGYRLGLSERLVLLVALFGFQPALFDFKMGQMGTILAAVLCFAFVFHERQRSTGSRAQGFASGALTTLGSSVKLFYATSGAHLLRDRRRLLSALGTAGLLLLVSVVAFGVDLHRSYLEVLLWGKGWGGGTDLPYLTRPAYYRPLHVLGSLRPFAILVGVLGVIGLALAARDEPGAARPTFALGIAAVPLLAPRAYTQDLVVLLLPAVILLAGELDREGGFPSVPVVAVLLLHVHSFGHRLLIEPVGPEWATILQPGAVGTLLLVGLAALRVGEHATVHERPRVRAGEASTVGESG